MGEHELSPTTMRVKRARAPQHPAPDRVDDFSVARLQATAGNCAVAAVLQRAVLTRRNPDNLNEWVYYSSLDTKSHKYFPDKQDAVQRDTKLRGRGNTETVFERGSRRPPTLYAYMHSKPHAVISGQGPHTVQHAAIAYRLENEDTVAGLRAVFKAQVATPAAVQRIIDETEKSLTVVNKRPDQRARYLYDYARYYKAADRMLGAQNPSIEHARQLIEVLLNLHPYASSGWKSMTKASKSALAGKAGQWTRRSAEQAQGGETAAPTTAKKRKASAIEGEDGAHDEGGEATDAFSDHRVDKGGLRSFNKREDYKAFLELRLSWLDDSKRRRTEAGGAPELMEEEQEGEAGELESEDELKV